MTDIKPATDEALMAHARSVVNDWPELAEAIARIRAETAKNSGDAVAGWLHRMNKTWPWDFTEDEAAANKFRELGHHVQSVYATPANSRAEAIRECIAVVEAMKETHSGIDDVTVRLRALLDKPQPDSRAEAIVKPLDWKAVRKAVIGADGYEITDMSAGNKQGWRGSFPGENTYRWFSTIEDAQDAAQGHYLCALLQQEGE